ncbi:class I SAM-dependent methyltransferase [Ramlibacter sp. Leaf400]|uniref:class I SAM-dependent methyltransferase n=1 Tax=Ramlibacter sp. Leaf400 TaxID=1736365 RepID=UPI000ACA2DF0|nr:class I SAM-dependent methyltransferase [Ramlibacter sp. Leaf400]
MTSPTPVPDPRQSACPACGGAWKRLYQKNGCEVSRCTVCGLGRAEPGQFDPASYYTEDYFNGSHSDGYSDYAASEQVLRHEFSRVADVLRRYCKPGARLLEIGCAYGFFLKEARSTFEVQGIEIAEEAVQACHRAGLHQVRQGSADEATLRRIGEVDAIVMLDVVEHLVDPFSTLETCSRQLTPGGALLITTGDFNAWVARLAGRRWRLMTPPQHLWYFTPESLRRIASRLGLEVVACTHPSKIVPLSLIFFQVGRMLGLKGRAPGAGMSKVGVPVNLFDAMRVVLRKPQAAAQPA